MFGGADTSFYLSGGAAASRGYLQHRFADDLDLFVNDEPRFVADLHAQGETLLLLRG